MSGYRVELELRWGGEFSPGTQWAITALDDYAAAVLRALPPLRPDGCPVQSCDRERPCLYLPEGTPVATAGHVVALVLDAAVGREKDAALLAAMVAHAWAAWGFERCGEERPGVGYCRLPKGHDHEHVTKNDVVWMSGGGRGGGDDGEG